MASINLYPPTIDTSLPAFVANGGKGTCRVYFSLSKLSSSTSGIKSVHISVVKQSSGQSVVNQVNTLEGADLRYRSTGIIMTSNPPNSAEGIDNYYYVDITQNDVKSGDKEGWQAGWIYKIQIRLSEAVYPSDKEPTPSELTQWLTANASSFSEWSTYCTVKAIGQPQIVIPSFDFDSSKDNELSDNVEKEIPLAASTLDFNGTYSNADLSEILYSYNLILYDEQYKILENTGEIFTNQYTSPNQMSYTLKTNLLEDKTYKIKLTYTTINKYSDYYVFTFTNALTLGSAIKISFYTVDEIKKLKEELEEELKKKEPSKDEIEKINTKISFLDDFLDGTTLEKENEEGRIGIKFYLDSDEEYNGNICLKRASNKDNYLTWSDIRIIVCKKQKINDLDIIYDNTIESGILYKYAIQTIDTNGIRSHLNPSSEEITPISRDFYFSYLIGENGQQLTLRYDNTMSSYTYTYSDTKTDTIGGQYPFITRNGNMKYRTFPINGLISFNMDENYLFLPKEDKEIIYELSRIYDFKREFDFREAVLAFLQDGKPKLFKSATEGNIIVRLMSVAAQPNQTVNRMISSFTSTAYEIAENTLENYLKYNFFNVGDYSKDFKTYSTKLGHLEMDFIPGENIINKIWEKYDYSNCNLAGTRYTLNKVYNLSIEFTDAPLRVKTSEGDIVSGNGISYKDSIIIVRGTRNRYYTFDENIIFDKGSSLSFLQGAEDVDKVDTIHAEINFIYDMYEEPYVKKQILAKITRRNLGQIYGSYMPNSNLYKELYYKFYYDWDSKFRRLTELYWTCIEAAPGAVFRITDEADADNTSQEAEAEYHDINKTGILNLEGLGSIVNLIYVGKRKPDGTIDKTVPCDIIVDYLSYTVEGTYKEG